MQSMFLTILAPVTLFVVLAITIDGLIGYKTVEWLHDARVDSSSDLPPVSIVVAARNEEKNIAEGLTSLLNLNYPNKKIIVVNDRSTDGTGEVLEKLKTIHPELNVTTITGLPEGWLGKNFAQYCGAMQAVLPACAGATNDFILFTDADIVMDRDVLRRAVPFMLENNVDHLAIGPKAVMPGFWLNLFMAGFAVFFNIYARPWRAKDPKSSAHIGIGAFNLIRRSAYEKIGTHKAIAMRPDDDMKLGKLVKKHGLHQDFLLGTDMIFVEWYASVRALVEGLMKNAFSGVEYNLLAVVAASVAQLVFSVWPFAAVFIVAGPAKWMYLASALLILLVCAFSAHAQRIGWAFGLGYPLACLMFLYILWKATLRTLINGGIDWRGTFYSLDDLKKNRV